MKPATVYAVCISLLSFLQVYAQAIPGDWTGKWQGILNIYSPEKGLAQSAFMQLEILPADSSHRWKWNITYGEGDKQEVREYLLIRKDAAKGLYAVDENNGILINEVLIGNKLFCAFSVSGSMLHGTVTFNKKNIEWEFISYRQEKKTTSGGEGEIPVVESYYPSVYQKAVLKKK